ncbi:putative L-Aspartase-like protein [Seiridium unicorne]|uniref:L-Aspartase-like protein n=1 Tax=Seiridium unicorne TaxID=138068 RepID=A0ABR2UGA2_9PEZI
MGAPIDPKRRNPSATFPIAVSPKCDLSNYMDSRPPLKFSSDRDTGIMFLPNRTFTDIVLSHWAELATSSRTVPISSYDLTIADVVAVSRHLTNVALTPEAEEAINKCSHVIQQKFARGDVIYGVNTGFGGSADMRTDAVGELQQSLFTLLMAGITSGGQPKLERQAPGPKVTANGTNHDITNGDSDLEQYMAPKTVLPLNQAFSTSMPESWVRASMLVRLNSLAAGASGVRLQITDGLIEMLNRDVVPLVPLRGSISASGDLSPLSYIGAVLQGKKYASAYCGARDSEGSRRLVRADAALEEAKIQPTDILAKEGLAIVNGTAVSAGVAALALHEALNLAALSQVLTAMSVEALRGTDESFEPFIARIRPHGGQVDSARNIFSFLAGSKLIQSDADLEAGELRQDRYAVRTASQWIGPVLEDFMLAHTQISIELNSVTDNPLINVAADRILHGGNFQAKAVTSAVEKLRQGLQSLGRMLFSQLTELINPATNRGLPANLVADDPARSYLFKGTDIMAAALTSELGFLANPVGSHVQTAEMGNQGINSLALISVRYTLDAVDVLSQLMSAHLVALCQALDLRARDILSKESLTSSTDEVLDASPYLGKAAKIMYRYVRKELQVPFITEARVSGALDEGMDGLAPSIGAYNTVVYEAIRSGQLYGVVVECLGEVQRHQATAPDGF